jgi:DNA-binding protein
LVIGNVSYFINSSFQNISNELRAGITSTQTTFGIIDDISIAQPGQGYAATNVVSIPSGDSFTITSVNTQNLEGDEARLQYWKPRVVGDNTSNPFPSFVGFALDSISFYKNRIVVTSRQNAICSQAGDYFNFFASTVITIVDSDPIDISASSLKPIRLKQVVPAPRGLILFGDNAQYILETTTEAFSTKTAEINLLSAYSQSDKVSPVDMGSSFVFVEEGLKAASVFEMNIGDNIGGKPVVMELTRPIPSYVPAVITTFKASQASNTLAMLSKQEPSSLYLYRFFMLGENRISGWFRWTMPGTIEHFDFDQDLMYVVTKHGSNYVLSVLSLITETPAESLLFEGEYLDVRLDLFDYSPTLTYDAGTDLTHVCFKDGFEDTNEQAVLMYLNPDVAGYFEEQTITVDMSKAVGQRYFLTVEGNQTTSLFALGYKYEALAQLPAFYYSAAASSGAGEKKDTVNVPYVSRLRIDSYNSGPYRAVVRAQGRNEFSLALPQISADYYKANNIPIIRNAQSVVPILAKGTQFEFELIADSPFPTAFTSVTWEGTYNTKGIRRV